MNQFKRGLKLAPVLPLKSQTTLRPKSLTTLTKESFSSLLESTATGVTTTERLPKTTGASQF